MPASRDIEITDLVDMGCSIGRYNFLAIAIFADSPIYLHEHLAQVLAIAVGAIQHVVIDLDVHR